MGFHAKMDAFSLDAASLASDFLAKVLADHAEARLAEAQAKNRAALGETAPYALVVDSRRVTGQGTTLGTTARNVIRETVRARKGRADFTLYIEFLFTALQLARLLRRGGAAASVDDDPLRWIARKLIERSPVQSGAYRDGHILLADGVEVGTAVQVAAGAIVPMAHSYEFINPVPYARRLEIGRTKAGRSFVLQVPNRIYQRTAKEAAEKFGIKAFFKYRFMPGAYRISGKMAARTPRYLTGELRKVTQTHWTGSGGNAGWQTFQAGEPKSRIRRNSGSYVKAPAIIVRMT